MYNFRPNSIFLSCILALTLHAYAAGPIRFHTDRAGYVSLNLYRADGTLVKQALTGKRFAAGDHAVACDAPDSGAPLPPGDYNWRAVIHDGLSLRLRGWVGDWGGDLGAPAAVAADGAGIYLGWSVATASGDSVAACDPAGNVQWTHHRGALSGCRALAVDAGVVYVLGGEGPDASGASLYKLNAKTGDLIRWPDGTIDLKISSLWPASQKDSPASADYLAARNGRIYLSFTVGNFIAILDSTSGAYLQTIVGLPPGALDSVATKCDSPDKPNTLVDADFVVIAFENGSIDKILLVHDPIWVITGELTLILPGLNITALTMLGDEAKHHVHDIFMAFGPPYHQVQARSALSTEVPTFVAGKSGGRISTGAWQTDGMSFIRALALDGTGQLWVAEGDAIPKRVSVWTTDAVQGRFIREFFAPPGSASPVAMHPLDPHILFAGGCEWRIDPRTGRAACLGIVTRDRLKSARFAVEKNRVLLVLTMPDGTDTVLERFGDGDYRPRTGTAPAEAPPKFRLVASSDGAFQFTSEDGFALASFFGKAGEKPRTTLAIPRDDDWLRLVDAPGTPALAQMSDGKVFLTAGTSRIWNLELLGLDTIHPIASGKISVPEQSH